MLVTDTASSRGALASWAALLASLRLWATALGKLVLENGCSCNEFLIQALTIGHNPIPDELRYLGFAAVNAVYELADLGRLFTAKDNRSGLFTHIPVYAGFACVVGRSQTKTGRGSDGDGAIALPDWPETLGKSTDCTHAGIYRAWGNWHSHLREDGCAAQVPVLAIQGCS